ncbi:hypothetical protein PV10_04851 [Exophiala mesophila]|uniref:C2H2-type domain-containing protein n=1 Tax=Exophiala mesophila TaxID=212818 RepID=A0A0D1XZG3_EXOME|nr:uncharacterized protein PV10_04851 [Exophiala mesophila]KIV93656.1 hypothetical protein PV10_04851 [Exophiala mesophila]
MTKKKRGHPDAEEILARPWCYYCERDFDDLKILINHQKAKHFKCERCGRRLNTAGGLSVHMSQVHKENLTAVDNALPNRAGLDIEIFGMEGIPEDIVQQHQQRVLTQFHQAQADRQAATGNAGAGAGGGNNANVSKKPKLEQLSDLKKRLAEHKAAKLAAEQDGATSSGNVTPNPAAQPQAQTPAAASPSYPGFQQQYAPPPSNGSYSQPPSFSQPPAVPAPYQAAPGFPPAGSPVQAAPYGQPPVPHGQPGYPPVPNAYPHQPYAQPPQPSFQQAPPPVGFPPQPNFSPPPFQGQAPYPGQSYPNATSPAQAYGPAGSPLGFPHPPQAQAHLPQRTHSPATNGNFPAPVRTGSVSLPNATGLPQRPAFGAPPVNAFQFQQMHQGQLPAPPNHPPVTQYRPQEASVSPAPQSQVLSSIPAKLDNNASSLDDLISSASKQADLTSVAATASPAAPAAASNPPKEDANEEKAAKKDKEKPKSTRLVYSDNEISPEEKMALLPKYAFISAPRAVAV